MKDGIIKLDSKKGLALGFTSDRFDGWLWKNGKDVYISFIISKRPGSGNLSRLFYAIWKKGYTVKVPTAFNDMEAICIKKGFTPTTEYDDNMKETVEIWQRKP